jgi:curved DNA-binding protein CbpA
MLDCCNGGVFLFPAGRRTSRKRKAVKKTPSGRILVPTDGSYCFDPYQLLQVRRDATDREITAGYRRFALLYHPVRRQSSTGDDAGFLFTAVSAAYETLTDDEARHALHQILADYYEESRTADSTTISDDHRCEARDERETTSNRSRRPTATSSSSLFVLQRQQQAKNATTKHDDSIEVTIPTATTNRNGIHSLLLFPTTTTAAAAAAASSSSSLLILQSASSSSTTPADTHHYSHEVSERLFGGPLKLMHQARRFEGFTDPYVIFARVFGSSLYSSSLSGMRYYQQPDDGGGGPSAPAAEDEPPPAPVTILGQPRRHAPCLPHHLEPHQHQQQRIVDNNGTACRQLGNRHLTRTMRRCGDRIHIAVTSVVLVDETTTTTTARILAERRDDDENGAADDVDDDDERWFPMFCCS